MFFSSRTAWRLSFAVLAVSALAYSLAASKTTATPSALFQELYSRVEMENLFNDSKTFPDAIPKRSPQAILADYRTRPPRTKEQLRVFVDANFSLPADGASGSPPPLPLMKHIAALWSILTRQPVRPPLYSSELPLDRPYVVPGGRFRELYYWDSYFTMLGLKRDRRDDLVANMVHDFTEMIARYGHIPNGTRTYYLSRSQPPVFFLMVALTSPNDPAGAYAKYLPSLRREYDFWMHGAKGLKPGKASEHVVALSDGAILNRYWDAYATPRDESYREDVRTALTAARPMAEVYRDLRSAAESGWDFSSRWLADGNSLSTIETTAIIPVDLNSLLFGLERAIAEGCRRAHDATCESDFLRRIATRRTAINRYLWNDRNGEFLDYQWVHGEQLDRSSAAMVYPLFVGLAEPEQANRVADAVRAKLLASGGIVTTTHVTGQQWDAPNGWAPLQWIAISGLNAYSHGDLAGEIAKRWLHTVSRTYNETSKLLEKYDVQEETPGGGGEYQLQDGFGWTNGVTRALIDLYPQFNSESNTRR
jgi:alpha,alpha-trehalase